MRESRWAIYPVLPVSLPALETFFIAAKYLTNAAQERKDHFGSHEGMVHHSKGSMVLQECEAAGHMQETERYTTACLPS